MEDPIFVDEELVRDYLPLQQGLRHVNNRETLTFVAVRDYLPLQQGLRLPFSCFLRFLLWSETIFHYNKD